jgi:hypothetical protein
MNRTTTYSILFAVLMAGFAFGIMQQENACPEASYEDHNQVDPKPLKVATLEGRGH